EPLRVIVIVSLSGARALLLGVTGLLPTRPKADCPRDQNTEAKRLHGARLPPSHQPFLTALPCQAGRCRSGLGLFARADTRTGRMRTANRSITPSRAFSIPFWRCCGLCVTQKPTALINQWLRHN